MTRTHPIPAQVSHRNIVPLSAILRYDTRIESLTEEVANKNSVCAIMLAFRPLTSNGRVKSQTCISQPYFFVARITVILTLKLSI